MKLPDKVKIKMVTERKAMQSQYSQTNVGAAIETVSQSREKKGSLIEELLALAKEEQTADALLKKRLGSSYEELIYILLSDVHVISERLNVFEGKGRDLSEAIRERDKKAVQKAILDQVKKGADSIDIQLDGLGVKKGAEEKYDLDEAIRSMEWTVQILEELEALKHVPFVIDSAYWEILVAGANKVSNRKVILNSIDANKEKISVLLPILERSKNGEMGVVILAASGKERGSSGAKMAVATTVQGKINAVKRVLTEIEDRVPLGHVYFDLGIGNLGEVMMEGGVPFSVTLEAMRNLKGQLPMARFTLGISNISGKMALRRLLHRTFTAMSIACGLDAPIADPADRKLMATIEAAKIIMTHWGHFEAELLDGKGIPLSKNFLEPYVELLNGEFQAGGYELLSRTLIPLAIMLRGFRKEVKSGKTWYKLAPAWEPKIDEGDRELKLVLNVVRFVLGDVMYAFYSDREHGEPDSIISFLNEAEGRVPKSKLKAKIEQVHEMFKKDKLYEDEAEFYLRFLNRQLQKDDPDISPVAKSYFMEFIERHGHN